MKKLIAIFLSLSLIFIFAGCGNSGQADKNPEINDLAISGKIDGVEFGLGSNVAEVKRHYSALAAKEDETHTEEDETHDHANEEFAYYNLINKETYTIIDIASARFYYLNSGEDKGIAAISTDGPTFGFTPGVTMKYEVEEAVEAKGETEAATEADLRFLPVRTEDVVILRYKYDSYQLNYYFYDNVLISTVLIDTSIWKI